MAEKRRYVGPSGAIFVPNVPDDTIAVLVAAGEWTEVVPAPEEADPPKPKRAPRVRQAD